MTARYLIDTDWTIDYLSGRQPTIERLQALQPAGLALSIISLAERTAHRIAGGISPAPRLATEPRPGGCVTRTRRSASATRIVAACERRRAKKTACGNLVAKL
jgi:hypothetical protein